MYKEEIAGIAIAVFVIILTILSYHWNVEVGKFIFAFLAGVFATYVIQHRLQRETEKREVRRQNFSLMRERVYGPILKNISLILKSVRGAEYGPALEGEESIEKIRADYLFYAVEKKLGKELSELLDKHEKYNRILSAATGILHDIIREETEKTLRIDIGSDARQVVIRLEVGKIIVTSLTLVEDILLEISPQEFIKTEREKWGENVFLTPRLYPKSEIFDMSMFESIYASVSDKMKNEPLFVEEKKMRMNLSVQMEKYLEDIKPFVSLE
jgi:DNA gyrase/topoisomerase IV subunit A